MKIHGALLALGVAGALVAWAPSVARAGAVNLNDWTEESYASVSGFPSGVWTVSGSGGEAVIQSQNGQPTMFYSDFNAFGTSVTGKIKVTGDDNDFIGFVLGFDPGDASSGSADYLLVDWKAGTQYYDFGSPSNDGGGTAPLGLAVSRVLGVPSADEFWQHATLSAGSGLTELARGATLGSTGWAVNTEYDFTFDFGPNNLKVSVDGVEQFNLTGSFANGRMGFYNFSQAGVTYSAFEVDPGSFPVVPLPPAAWLGLAMLGGLGLTRRLRKNAV